MQGEWDGCRVGWSECVEWVGECVEGGVMNAEGVGNVLSVMSYPHVVFHLASWTQKF